MNIGAPWPDLDEAERRVLVMQTKLHQWAVADPGRRFDDLANLVYDPAFLVVAWSRVWGNKGARTAGVDGIAPRSVVFGAAGLLGGLREDLKAGRFVPQRVREKTIPKAGGKVRSLGILTTADRIVQAVVEAGARADLRGGLQAMVVWLPSGAPSSGRHRRDSLPRVATSELRVGARGGHQGVLRRDRPHRTDGPGATSYRRQACPGMGEGVLARLGSSPRRASTARRSLAHPKEGSSHHCWPTSLCPCWTSTSHTSGKRSDHSQREANVAGLASRS